MRRRGPLECRPDIPGLVAGGQRQEHTSARAHAEQPLLKLNVALLTAHCGGTDLDQSAVVPSAAGVKGVKIVGLLARFALET